MTNTHSDPHSHPHNDHDGDHSAHDGHHHASNGGHSHAPKDFGRAFALGVALNVTFVAVEVVSGLVANSMALLADSGHNLSDVVGLLIAWGASHLVRRAPTHRYTYGLGSSSILAALANAIFLLVACGAIAWEAMQRLDAPQPVAGAMVMSVAGLGVIINGLTAWLFASGTNDINIRGAFLHMAGDAAISLGVVIAGAITLLTGWQWLDPVISLVIVALIVWSTWSLLLHSVAMALHAVPPNIDPADVRAFLLGQDGVAALHDLHIWPMSTTETALTCHLVMPAGHPGDEFLIKTSDALNEQFRIRHVTLQVEFDGTKCILEPDGVV